MDTLRAARHLEQSGFPKEQAEAIVRVAKGERSDLLTKDYLDKRLWQHAAMIVGAITAAAGLLKLLG